jgi:vacuolar-type H+-ATPase subunit C/Vma6
VERQLDRRLIREAIGLARQDPLGIGVAMAYIERKVNEVRNLRTIMRGKAAGMGAGQIMEWLIL